MNNLVKVSKDNDIAIITIDNPPVNALSPGVPDAIGAAIDEMNSDPAIKAAVVIGAGRTFVAGADIKEFGKMTSGEPRLVEACSRSCFISKTAPSRWSWLSTARRLAAAWNWPWPAITASHRLPRRSGSRK